MRMSGVIAVALALWPAMASAAEKWSCTYQFNGEGKVTSQEWVISGQRAEDYDYMLGTMVGPAGYGHFVVEVNNADTVTAFARQWTDENMRARVRGHFPNTGNHYVVIDKRTGFSVVVHDALGNDHGVEPEAWSRPLFQIGHCQRTEQ
jgi:hypothetical protein